MNLNIISQLLLFGCILNFCRKSQSAPITDIFNYGGARIPEDCKETIKTNPLLHIGNLPAFKDISPTDIKTAYECAKKFFQENIERAKDISSENIKYTFNRVIETPLLYVRSIKKILLLNNFTTALQEINRNLDLTGDNSEKLSVEYNKLSERYRINMQNSKKFLTLYLENNILDPSEFSEPFLKHWSQFAKLRGYSSSSPDHGPWIVPYEDLAFVGSSTKSNELKDLIMQRIAEVGHIKGHCDNEPVIENLRQLYTNRAENRNFRNVVDMKMGVCMAENYENINDLLYMVEKTLAIKQNSHPVSQAECSKVRTYLNDCFPHNHVIKELFKLIEDLFKISIRERTLPYQTFADGMKLYEVHERKEKIGEFYIDYFERPGQKISLSSYTQPLKHRWKDLNIIPLVFISLRTKSSERFSLTEIGSLFHEMGHCLQMIFTDKSKIVTYGDTHEFPSKFMEHFAKQSQRIIDLSAENSGNRILTEKMTQYQNQFQNVQRLKVINNIHNHLIDLDLFHKPQVTCDKVIKNVREKIYFKKSYDIIYRSKLPEFHYAGTDYVYLLSEIMAIDAYNHLYSDPSKINDRALEFRRLVFEMKDVESLAEAFRKFVNREKINIEHFYKFYGISSNVDLITI